MHRILIVEDDEDMIRALEMRLSANGYETVYAKSPDSALETVEVAKPDVILLDLGLLDGDGFKVLDKLAARDPTCKIPVIVITSRDPASNRERTLRGGASAFLQKPFANEEILATIEDIISRATTLNDLDEETTGDPQPRSPRLKIIRFQS